MHLSMHLSQQMACHYYIVQLLHISCHSLTVMVQLQSMIICPALACASLDQTQIMHAGDSTYEAAAVAALTQLWSMRSPLSLVGTSIHMTQAVWNNRQGGTGAGVDSFYEYLLKAYVLFGKSDPTPAVAILLLVWPLLLRLLHLLLMLLLVAKMSPAMCRIVHA